MSSSIANSVPSVWHFRAFINALRMREGYCSHFVCVFVADLDCTTLFNMRDNLLCAWISYAPEVKAIQTKAEKQCTKVPRTV